MAKKPNTDSFYGIANDGTKLPKNRIPHYNFLLSQKKQNENKENENVETETKEEQATTETETKPEETKTSNEEQKINNEIKRRLKKESKENLLKLINVNNLIENIEDKNKLTKAQLIDEIIKNEFTNIEPKDRNEKVKEWFENVKKFDGKPVKDIVEPTIEDEKIEEPSAETPSEETETKPEETKADKNLTQIEFNKFIVENKIKVENPNDPKEQEKLFREFAQSLEVKDFEKIDLKTLSSEVYKKLITK